MEVLEVTLFHCPDCDRIHDEPFEAATGLLARCVDCSLEQLLGAERRRATTPAALAA